MTIIEEKRNKIMNKILITEDESLLDFINILTDISDEDENQIDLE